MEDADESDLTHTIYVIVWKKGNEPFAWCDSKYQKKRFFKERGKGIFRAEKIRLSDIGYSVFYSKYHEYKLQEIPLFDGKEWYHLLATSYEDAKLAESQDEIENDLYTIRDFYSHQKGVYSKRVLDLIKKATTVTSKTKDAYGRQVDLYLEIDTFRLFYHLEKDTFNLGGNYE